MRARDRRKRRRHVRDIFPLCLFKRNMRRLHARNRSCGLRRTMERRQSLLLLSPERLTTALSYPPERQGLPTILQLIEPPRGHRPMLQPRSQEMEPHAPTSLCRIIGRTPTERIAPRRHSRTNTRSPIARSPVGPNRIVRPQLSRTNVRSLTGHLQRSRTTDQSPTMRNRVGPNRTDRPQPSRNDSPSPIILPQRSRTIGLSLTGVSLLSGRKRLRRTSVPRPSTLLLRKHDLDRNSGRRRSRRRKRKSSRTNSQRGNEKPPQ